MMLLGLFLLFVAVQAPDAAREPQEAGSAPISLYTVPLDPALRTELDAAVKARNYERAETLLAHEIEKDPKSPQLLTLLGGIFFLEGNYLSCAIAMKKAEALAPLDERSRFTLAMSYIVIKRGDWARPELEKLVAAAPGSPLYPYWIARLDYDVSLYEAALAGFQKALQLDPGFVRAYDNLGLCYEALGKFTEAIESYREAARLNRRSARGSPWPPLNLAILLSRSGAQEEVEGYLREALRYDAGFAQAHYQLGILWEKQQRPEDAVKELEQAASLDPAYPEPHYALARVYRRIGQVDKADKALQVFLKLKGEKERK